MGVVIKSKTDGFRRGGIAHRTEGTYYPDGMLTEQQLAVMRGDPHLLVVEGVQEDALQADQSSAELLQEMGNTIAALEHELEQARAGLRTAASDVMRILEHQKSVPDLVVQDANLLVQAHPGEEGVICILADDLANLITEHLKPQQAMPEAQSDGTQSTLGGASGPDSSSNPAPIQAVAPATGGQPEAVNTENAPKRGRKKGDA
ncbi:HI1506-related protein [Pseudomonas sp. NPDC089554]|uniref:HI1506-related protein n=1 Tax=Pseudomonas sp. NPDC089554 TaxID=3390653 RepID=UPI003CFE18D7